MPPILGLPKELLVDILSLLPFRWWHLPPCFLTALAFVDKSYDLQGLASCWGFLPMFAHLGHRTPALQSFLFKALSSAGLTFQMQSLLQSLYIFRGSKPSWRKMLTKRQNLWIQVCYQGGQYRNMIVWAILKVFIMDLGYPWEFLRCYKQKVFSLLKPDHYHCKGSYNYYIQVSASLKFCLHCNCKIHPSISFIQVSANLKLIA